VERLADFSTFPTGLIALISLASDFLALYKSQRNCKLSHAPLLGLSGTMGDNEKNLQAQKKRAKNSVFGGL